MTSRLSSVAADLADLLTAQPESVQRAVAAKAAEWALGAVEVSDPRLDAGLRLLAASEYGPGPAATALESLVDELDDVAFDLHDDGDDAGYAKAFDRARAAHSVLFALEPDPVEAVLEASYEAIMAREVDVEGFRALVRGSLTA